MSDQLADWQFRQVACWCSTERLRHRITTRPVDQPLGAVQCCIKRGVDDPARTVLLTLHNDISMERGSAGCWPLRLTSPELPAEHRLKTGRRTHRPLTGHYAVSPGRRPAPPAVAALPLPHTVETAAIQQAPVGPMGTMRMPQTCARARTACAPAAAWRRIPCLLRPLLLAEDPPGSPDRLRCRRHQRQSYRQFASLVSSRRTSSPMAVGNGCFPSPTEPQRGLAETPSRPGLHFGRNAWRCSVNQHQSCSPPGMALLHFPWVFHGRSSLLHLVTRA